ncbi:MAG: hypothetical protein Q9220_004874 [cf. Caloplaca sp. 1 TL-2023]
MRLLLNQGHTSLGLVEFDDNNIPRYAVLSHTWGADKEEVSFKDMIEGIGKDKAGYSKIQFCKRQAAADGIQHLWVDTCCIDKSSTMEVSEAINSMFRWYRNAAECYVYLSDVSKGEQPAAIQSSPAAWQRFLQGSRWFSRGWTLQELVAPDSVRFFSREGHQVGCKRSLEQPIHEITSIAAEALRGAPLTDFQVGERMSWAEHRNTRRPEDKAYSLLGIFNIHMPLLYGEGREKAFIRLQEEIERDSKRKRKWNAYLEIAQDETHDSVLHRQFLDSLFFPEINSRLEQIPEAFKQTCRWIFDTPARKQQRRRQLRYNFHEWLSSGKGIYWISGKPGSGKSTLMKFIVNEEQTEQALDAGRGDQNVLIISFFFWGAGTSLQKSATGLLRSLLYQITRKYPELINTVKNASSMFSNRLETSIALRSTWTDQRLISLLDTFINHMPTTISLCAFVDGLDEFVGDEDLLLDMVRLFSQAPQCKLCVSSRPEPKFRQEFETCPRIQMQDFNTDDCYQMVNGRLIPVLEKRMDTGQICFTDSNAQRIFTFKLVEKSAGVFLWLDLMIKDLIRGSNNGDTFEQLSLRLERTPATVDGMYAHILESLDPIYHAERLRYFFVLLAAEEFGIQVSSLILASAQGEPWECGSKSITTAVNSACQRVATRLGACCSSLVDIPDHQRRGEGQIEGLDDKERERKELWSFGGKHGAVLFIHKTAAEYVRKRYHDLLRPRSLMEAKATLARGIVGFLSFILSIYDGYSDWRVLYCFGSILSYTMNAISALGHLSSDPAVNDSSAATQTDLTDRVFQLLQRTQKTSDHKHRGNWDSSDIYKLCDPFYKELNSTIIEEWLVGLVKAFLSQGADPNTKAYYEYRIKTADYSNFTLVSDSMNCSFLTRVKK